MGLTEGHLFEDYEYLSERQLENTIERENEAYERGYQRGLQDCGCKMRWISVKDKLPEEFMDVLVYAEYESVNMYKTIIDKRKGIFIGWYGDDSRWHADMKRRITCLYWMPIIEPPKEQ